MDLQSIHEFLRKYAANNYTEQEHQAFIEWLRSAPVEQVQEMLETYLHLAEMHAGSDFETYPHLIEKIETRLNEIDNPSVHPTAKTVRLWPKLWKMASVAAIFFVLAGLSLFFWLKRMDLHKPLSAQIKAEKSIEIKPGGDKAILTLANGSQIILDNVQNGVVATQSGISIRKDANGKVVFDASSVAVRNLVPGFNTITTPRGGQYQIVLPDGSRVWLNAASSLKFPTFFPGSERNVELTGEAYFEVAKNKDKPFKVFSQNQTVEVLGTHFNINAYPDEGVISTTLLEGSVRVSKHSADGRKETGERLLKPGQQAKLGADIQVSNADVQAAMAWKNGYFVFAHEPIQNIMRQLSRWYDVDVVYQGKATTENFTGTISRFENISEVLDMLQLTGAVHFKIESQTGNMQKPQRRIIVMP
jgi:ferric-dicitrate binding protein FerR (iron transport regulator)